MFGFKENFKNESKAKKNDLPDKEDYRYREHNPSEHPLSGLQADGWDVVDPEQWYNMPDFKEEFKNYEIEDEAELDLETEELLAKYNFEEIDLKMYGESARKFLRGQGRPPFRDINQNRELAAWYEKQLCLSNEQGLPFSEQELARLTDTEKEELTSLYQERADVQNRISQLLGTNKTESELEQVNVVYSTAKNTSNSQEKKYQADLNVKQLTSQLYKLNSEIIALENKLLTDPSKQKQKEAAQKRKEELQLEKELKQSMPEYSVEEIKLQDECLDYLTIRQNKKDRKPRPGFADGQPMTGEQILEVAQEGALEKIKSGEMMQGVFFEENYKGQRQLAYVEKNGNKRIKYILISPILPAGKYAFKIDTDTMFVAKNNPNSAMVHINLMVNLANPKEVMKEIMANKNKNISNQKNQTRMSA